MRCPQCRHMARRSYSHRADQNVGWNFLADISESQNPVTNGTSRCRGGGREGGLWVGVEVVGAIPIDESQLTKTPRFYKMKGKLLWPE